MTKNLANEELAKNLRNMLIREVVTHGQQLNALNHQINILHSSVHDFEKNKKTVLQSFLDECEKHLKSRTLQTSSVLLEQRFNRAIADVESKNENDILLLNKKLQERECVSKIAEETLLRLSKDVLVEKYGRGELILTKNGLQRIIGRIIDLDESITSSIGIVLGDSNVANASMNEIVWMCENNPQNPPLFFVDMKLMPLNDEEIARICHENNDYDLLVKNIPEDQVDWQDDSVFCINKNTNI